MGCLTLGEGRNFLNFSNFGPFFFFFFIKTHAQKKPHPPLAPARAAGQGGACRVCDTPPPPSHNPAVAPPSPLAFGGRGKERGDHGAFGGTQGRLGVWRGGAGLHPPPTFFLHSIPIPPSFTSLPHHEQGGGSFPSLCLSFSPPSNQRWWHLPALGALMHVGGSGGGGAGVSGSCLSPPCVPPQPWRPRAAARRRWCPAPPRRPPRPVSTSRVSSAATSPRGITTASAPARAAR